MRTAAAVSTPAGTNPKVFSGTHSAFFLLFLYLIRARFLNIFRCGCAHRTGCRHTAQEQSEGGYDCRHNTHRLNVGANA